MLTPLRDSIFGKKVRQDKQESSLIIRPFGEEEEQNLLIVSHVGPDVREVKVEDIVILPPRMGTEIQILDPETKETERVFVIQEEFCLAYYREEEEVLDAI